MSRANSSTSLMEEEGEREEEQHMETGSADADADANITKSSERYELSPIPHQVNEEIWCMNLQNQNQPVPEQPNHIRDDISFSSTFNSDQDNTIIPFLNPFVESSSSFQQNPSIFTNLDASSQSVQYFQAQNPNFSSLFSGIPSTPLFDHNNQNGLFLEPQPLISFASDNEPNTDAGFFGGLSNMNSNNVLGLSGWSLDPNFATNTMSLIPEDRPRFDNFERVQNIDNGLANSFENRSNILRPLDPLPSSGAQPTLYQKRAAKWNNEKDSKKGKDKVEEEEKKDDKEMKIIDGEAVESGNGLNNDEDSDHGMPEDANNDGKLMLELESGNNGGKDSPDSPDDSTTVDPKGKKRGPSKNLMAERRRRKKVNDRLFLLRSIVPNISKMDKASILGDAVEYMKALKQKINDLNNELHLAPPTTSPSPSPSPSLHQAPSLIPLSPTTLPAIPSRMNQPLSSSFPSPNGLPAKVEVGLMEGGVMNIHMVCDRKPGVLFSTLNTLDNLGLDIQQGVISSYNGFVMDIFRAEQCNEGQNVHPDQIKAALIQTANSYNPNMI